MRDYIYLNGVPIARISSTSEGKQYYITDHLGAPVAMTNGSKTLTWKGQYYPFGLMRYQMVSVTNNLRYPGQWADDEVNLYYNWHRHYHPSWGRYWEADPVRDRVWPNVYPYAILNPLRWTDPKGLKVYWCERNIEVGQPTDFLAWLFRLKHEFIKTDSKVAGMGPFDEGPLPKFPCGIKTKITDHSSDLPRSTCVEQKYVDEDCVNRELEIGKYLGMWSLRKTCVSFVSDVLNKCRKVPLPQLPSPWLLKF